jgi:long-chain acyl-CoA synthetase
MDFSKLTGMSETERIAYLASEFQENGQPIYAASFLARSAKQHPDRIALICDAVSMSYAELWRRANHVTQLLRSKGVKPRDRVIIIFENSIEFYIAYYGAWQAGAVVAPINTFLAERELRHIVEDAKPAAIIGAQTLIENYRSLASVIITETDMQASVNEVTIDALSPDELCVLLYTSGTTGFPKGVMFCSRGIVTSVIQGIARLEPGKEERIFGLLPLFHSFAQNACIWSPLMIGATVIVVKKIERKNIIDGLKHEPTIFLGVPALYGLLCVMRNLNFDSVRYFLCGSDALADKIRAYFELIYRRKLCNGYGLTEAGPTISLQVDDELVPASCVGKPLTGVSCEIRDESGAAVPQGAVGVLWVKGTNVMLGYYQAEEMTKAVLQNGWLNTGDFARLDSQGRLHIEGRAKDLIKHKGINIYPPEVENVIMSHPAVTLVAVVGKQAPEVGEIPIAFIALRAPMPGIEAELKALCMQQLANYKVPRQFIVVETMPMTALGKVDKKKLRAEYLHD